MQKGCNPSPLSLPTIPSRPQGANENTMVSLVFLLLGIPLMKAAYGLFEKLMRFLWTAFLVAFVFSFFYIICLGAATSALWAIHRERHGRRSEWQLAASLAMLGMSMYLLTGPMLKETDFLFRITAEGVLVAGVLLVVYVGMRLHRFAKSGQLSHWASTGLTVLTAAVMSTSFLSFDRSWHVSRIALARGEEYRKAYQELKREKYRGQHVRFLEGRRRIAVKDLYGASYKNRRVLESNDYLRRQDSLVLLDHTSMVGLFLYTLEDGLYVCADKSLINGFSGMLENGKFRFFNPELDPMVEEPTGVGYALHNNRRILTETSIQVQAIPESIDAFIAHCESRHVGTDKPMEGVYFSLDFARRYGISTSIPTIQQEGEGSARERRTLLIDRKL